VLAAWGISADGRKVLLALMRALAAGLDERGIPAAPFAADRPGLLVVGDDDISKCGAGGGVKQFFTLRDVTEHIGCCKRQRRVADDKATSALNLCRTKWRCPDGRLDHGLRLVELIRPAIPRPSRS
jgi:hypothetical protein